MAQEERAKHSRVRTGTRFVNSTVARLMVWSIVLYQRLLSPLLPNTCRFEPSCSQYAREAIEKHGPARGLWYALRRIGRCHPFGGRGYDPVR